MTDIKDLSHIKPVIRPFLNRDLDQMKKIEKRAFIDYPWTSEDFAFFLRRLNRNHKAYIAEWREHLLGFMLAVEFEWNYEIASIAVSPEFRRIGVGSLLIDHLKSKLIPYTKEDIYCRVRETNKQAQEFFKEQGFYTMERVKACYDDMSEGCFKMKYEMEPLPLKEEYVNL